MKPCRIYIHQPDYAPWIAYFQRLKTCDYHVVLDHVQFPRRGWVHRDKIISPIGKEVWLTIPINKQDVNTPISYIEAASSGWREEHLMILKSYYKSYPYFNSFYEVIESSYNDKTNNLRDFNLILNSNILRYLGIYDESIYRYVSSDYEWNSKGEDLMIEIMSKFNCNTYISGAGAKNYIHAEKFLESGLNIEEIFSDVNSKLKNPNASIIHQLFDNSIEDIRNLILYN